jgi:hypothetical protein
MLGAYVTVGSGPFGGRSVHPGVINECGIETSVAIPFGYALGHIVPTYHVDVVACSGVRAGRSRVRRHTTNDISRPVSSITGLRSTVGVRIARTGHDLDLPAECPVGRLRRLAGATGRRRRRDPVGVVLSDAAGTDRRSGNQGGLAHDRQR